MTGGEKVKPIKHKDFTGAVKVYGGIRDAFGKSCLLLINEDLHELRVVGKIKVQEKKTGFSKSNVIVRKYGEVIDFTRSMVKEIENMFPGYVHTEWQIWD